MASSTFPLAIVLQTVDKTSTGFGKATGNLDKLRKRSISVGKSMTKSLTLPIVGIGVASVSAFTEFEAGMANVSTLVDTSTESMKDMRKAVMDIGSRTPVAINKLTSGLFDIRSAGIPAANAMNVLERSAQLGVAGLGSTEQAARLAAGAINAWGLEGKDADKIFNTIFQTTKNGITTIAGLEQGFGAVAGKMASAGIEADDYFASVAALTTTTLKASEAHTQMKAAIDGLEKSGKKTGKVFRKLGVKDFRELVRKTGSVTEAFRAVKEAVGDESGALKDLIGSSEGAAAVMALVGKQGDKQIATLADMRKETEGLSDVQVAFNKQNKTSAAQWQTTKNSLTSAAVSIGTVLAPALTTVARKIREAAEWFGKLDDSTKATVVKIAAITAVVGPMLVVIGKVAPGVGLIITAMKALAVIALAHPVFALLAALTAVAALTSDGPGLSEGDKQFASDLRADPNSRINRLKKQREEEAAWVKSLTETEEDEAPGLPEGTTGTARVQGLSESPFRFADPRFVEAEKRQRNGADVASQPNETSKSHVTLELIGDTKNVRVRSVTGEDMIDVKTGNQGR